MAPVRQPTRRHPGGGERRSPRHALALCVLGAVTLVTLDLRAFAPLEAVRGAVRDAIAPAGELAAAARPAGDTWRGGSTGDDLRRENDELRRHVEDLEAQLLAGRAARTELARIEAALGLATAVPDRWVTARVTAGPVADFDVTVQIDRGADAGIAEGMPVVVAAGLVGTVVEVSAGRAVIRLVSDRSTRVGVEVQGSATRGLVEGLGGGRRARAGSFDVVVDVPAGARLVTAGTPGSLYPPGIPVGETIGHAELDAGANQQVAEVRLAVDVDELTFVTVLLRRPT